MDWSKAKTILIVIFLILNIFLIINIAGKESRVTVISQKDILEIQTILKNNGILLEASLPNEIKPKALLKVEDIVYDENNMVNKFIGENSVKSTNENSTVYIKDSKMLEINKNKSIIFTDSNPKDTLTDISKSNVKKYFEGYLRNRGINLKNVELASFSQTNEGYKVKFVQVFDNNPIFVSYFDVNLTNAGITKLSGRWINPIGFIEASKDIKSPTEILLMFAKDISNANTNNTVIKSMSLGYYSPIESLKNATISIAPVWEIQTNDKVYYYNAYEGYLEDSLK